MEAIKLVLNRKVINMLYPLLRVSFNRGSLDVGIINNPKGPSPSDPKVASTSRCYNKPLY